MNGLAVARFTGRGGAPGFGASVSPPGRLRAKRLQRDPQALAIIRAVSRLRHVGLAALLGRARGTAEVAAARQLAMYLVHVLLARTQIAVGNLFGRDDSTVSHACRIVEDQRDDPVLESEIARVEAALAMADIRHAA